MQSISAERSQNLLNIPFQARSYRRLWVGRLEVQKIKVVVSSTVYETNLLRRFVLFVCCSCLVGFVGEGCFPGGQRSRKLDLKLCSTSGPRSLFLSSPTSNATTERLAKGLRLARLFYRGISSVFAVRLYMFILKQRTALIPDVTFLYQCGCC